MPSHKIEKTMRELGIDNMRLEDYIPSEHDNPHLISIREVDLLRNFGGRGAFAKKDIKEGETIGTYTGVEYKTEAEYKKVNTSNADTSFAMAIGKGVVDAKPQGNFTRFINHSDMQDNVEFVNNSIGKKKVIDVVATRDIKKGEQLLIDYNTYDERVVKEFFFLNASDNWLSAREVYEEHREEYQLIKINIDLPLFNIEVGDLFYVTPLGVEIFKNYGGEIIHDKADEVIILGSNLIVIEDDEMEDEDEIDYKSLSSLSSLFFLEGEESDVDMSHHDKKEVAQDIIDLPFLKIQKDGKTIMDFNQADSFTALMYACYWGQVENVRWLIDAGANIDQQQNRSGKNALFFALEGYSEGLVIFDRYLDIIRLLVDCNANTAIYDRTENTFLHRAAELLSKAAFESLINHLKNADLKKILSYLNQDNLDPILYCFKMKYLEKAEILLNYYPEFFEDTFSEDNEDTEAFITFLNTYTPDEKHTLLQLFKKFEVDQNTDLIDILGLDEDSVQLKI